MSSPAHLDNHHRNTLRQLLEHPASHNIEWHAVLSLLEVIGTVERRHDGAVVFTTGSLRAVLHPGGHKDVDTETAAELRRLLSAAGYSEGGSGGSGGGQS